MGSPLLGILTLLIMAAVGYAYLREGLFTAFTMFINVLVASFIAFNFYEPIAAALDPGFGDQFFHGYGDSISLVTLFGLTLGLLRFCTNSLAYTEVFYHPALLRGGGVVFGAATGYLACGFLAFVLATLPWQENFLETPVPNDTGRSVRWVLPPDQVWLALMDWTHDHTLSTGDKGYNTAANPNNLEIRLGYYRRHVETINRKPFNKETDEKIIQGLKERRKQDEQNLQKGKTGQ